MRYYKTNNIHIIEVPIKDFKIVMNDSKKKSVAPKNYCNAGFFANFSENGQPFTLPVAHLVCDYNANSSATKKYCTERGKFNGNKFTFDSSTWSYNNQFYKKSLSTLLIKNDKAEIKDIISIPSGYNYAISGIPVIRNGIDVSYNNYVKTQGWDSSPLYATWHIFIGLKKDANIIYVIGMQSTTWNLILTSEAYNKFKTLDMYDVIKLDGGGSFYMNVNGKAVASTYEDRRINTIICFDESDGAGKVRESNGDNKTSDFVNTTSITTTSNKTDTTTTNTTIKKIVLSSTVKSVKNFIKNKYGRINGFRLSLIK